MPMHSALMILTLDPASPAIIRYIMSKKNLRKQFKSSYRAGKWLKRHLEKTTAKGSKTNERCR